MALDPIATLLMYLLGKIADKAVEEAIKKGIDIAKSTARGEFKPRIGLMGGLSLPKSQLVNMDKEIRAIRQALSEVSGDRLIYLIGEGGTGKTRLLEEAAKIAPKNGWQWGGIIDLYHSDFHSILQLQKAIADNIDPQNLHFKKYRQFQNKLERWQSAGLTTISTGKNLAELEDIFLEDFNKFVLSKPVAIAFDTLEKIDDEYDIVQRIGEGHVVSFTTKQWLFRFCGRIKNTVTIMAGRPAPNLQRQLEREFSQPGRLEVMQLNGLTREDTKQLLKLYSKQEHKLSAYLDPYTDILWQYTKGSPARLAMVVELSRHIISNVSSGQLSKQESADDFMRQMVHAFFDYQDPERRLLFLLALARKGMNTDLLIYLEPSWPFEACAEKLESLRHLSLIKTRPAKQDIFLHDALYETFDSYITINAEIEFQYKNLREYHEAKRIASAAHDREGWQESTINSLYYGLRQNPLRTFQNEYLQWSELAIRGFEIDLDLQMRDELLSFLRNENRNSDKQPHLSIELVTLDSIVRWVKRFIFQSQYQHAIRLAEIILAQAPKQYRSIIHNNFLQENWAIDKLDNGIRNALSLADAFFWGHLLTYYGDALIYASSSEFITTKIIHKGMDTLGKIDTTYDKSLQWLKSRILGHGYDRLGYLSRLNGHNGKAAYYYEQAIKYFEGAKIEDEYAMTLNNLAYALALIGDLAQANIFIDQALSMRQKIGQTYPTALSYNTRGLIQSVERPEDGLHDCRIALNRFESIGADRGIGLACNALGYILRQIGNKWRIGEYNPDQARKFYDEARTFLERAQEKFEIIREPSRLWEAYNEQGSLYNDWGLLLEAEKNDEVAQQKYLLSEKYHLQALKVALH